MTMSTTTDAQVHLLIGTYTNGGSEGIYSYKFDSQNGNITPLGVCKTDNPSFLAISPDKKFVYAVNENGSANNPGSVASFAFNKKSGTLSLLNLEPTGGAHPCYVAIDKTGKWVTAGNYSGGSVSVFPVKEKGFLDKVRTVEQHEGHSVNTKRQDRPHVHATIFSPDDNYLLVPDLGTDKVMIYRLNKNNGALEATEPGFFKTDAGAGPRHLDFHPPGRFAYLSEEMSGNVTALKYNDGKLEKIETLSAHPADFKGNIGTADIHVSPDGEFLYVSNRGDANNIAIFSIDQQSGRLSLKGFQPVSGKTPRNFGIDPSGNFLLAANQDSNEVVIFQRDKKSGLLTDTGKRIAVEKPVCIKWID